MPMPSMPGKPPNMLGSEAKKARGKGQKIVGQRVTRANEWDTRQLQRNEYRVPKKGRRREVKRKVVNSKVKSDAVEQK